VHDGCFKKSDIPTVSTEHAELMKIIGNVIFESELPNFLAEYRDEDDK
jgi:hypothetical protein